MGLRDDDFPGRHDKLIWAFLLFAFAPIAVWFFRSYRLAHWPEPVAEPDSSLRRNPRDRRSPSRPDFEVGISARRFGRRSLLADIFRHMSDWILLFIWSDTLGRHLTTHVLMGMDGEDRQTAPAMGTIKRGNSSGSENPFRGRLNRWQLQRPIPFWSGTCVRATPRPGAS